MKVYSVLYFQNTVTVPALRPRRAEAQPNQAEVGPWYELEEGEAPRIQGDQGQRGQGRTVEFQIEESYGGSRLEKA